MRSTRTCRLWRIARRKIGALSARPEAVNPCAAIPFIVDVVGSPVIPDSVGSLPVSLFYQQALKISPEYGPFTANPGHE
jgi:hypothetical protein